MPITDKQRERRIRSLGSSDMAAVLGVDPWKNAYDVYLEKTGQLPDGEKNETDRDLALDGGPAL